MLRCSWNALRSVFKDFSYKIDNVTDTSNKAFCTTLYEWNAFLKQCNLPRSYLTF